VSASELPAVDCVASLAGANLGLWAEVVKTPAAAELMGERLEHSIGPILGTNGSALVVEVLDNEERFDLRRHAAALAKKPVLLVAGRRDDVVPPEDHHEPLAAAISAQPGARLHTALLDADHSFADTRVALARLVIDWLESECR
jgi:fermentation-respiration switch protein FrsA (DUF1100 family)